MEALIEHMLEPEVAGPAPRRTRLPLRVSLLLAVAILLLGVFVLGSGRALWEAARLSWLAASGHTAIGRIVRVETEPAEVKGQQPHPVAVRYACDLPASQGTIHREGWIGLAAPSASFNGPSPAVPLAPGKVVPKSQTPPAPRLGQRVPIRYASWFGGVASQPWQPDPRGRVLTLILSGSLVMLVSLLLLRRLLRWLGERLHLLRLGTATVGTITHKRTEAEDMVRYFLHYGYASRGSDGERESREHEEQVSMDQWKLFHVGQPVTVLYDPDLPERVGLYALIRH